MGLLLMCLLFSVLHSQLTSSSSTHHLCHHDESSALLQFKQIFTLDTNASSECDNDGYPKTVSWNDSSTTDCCTWNGVTCNGLTGHVIGLDLNCSRLHGPVHSNSSLFRLSHLQRLNLAHNLFDESLISSEFGNFLSLTHLNLSHSIFSGEIPSEISHLSKLVSLDLSWNDMMTVEPHSFKKLLHNLTELFLKGVELSSSVVLVDSLMMNLSSSLTSLNLSSFGLQGKLPNSIFHLPNLETLILYDNPAITGHLPEFNSSSPLRLLDLSYCYFLGSIPKSIGNLTHITYLDFLFNNFSGQIPSMLSNLGPLTYLGLSDNNFEGQVPNVFAKLTHLVYVDFSYNYLTGPIPCNTSGLPYLTHLDFSGNSLNGTIPSWLFTLPSLTELYLYENQLTGQIDEFKCMAMETMVLSNNELHGPIPHSISKLVNLTKLFLRSNNFNDVVDLNMFSKLKNLKSLDLSYNNGLSLSTNSNLNSTLPNFMVFSLSSCNITEFPDFLRSLENLEELNLSNNSIHGQIPKWFRDVGKNFLQSLYLSNNFLTGPVQLPWKNLQYLDLQSNLLQGPLPVPPLHIHYFSISNNKLTGTIPSSFCNLTSLQSLDLSYNSLSGAIPQCLGNFSDSLLVLNLQMNGFQRPVPPSLVNCRQLQALALENNKMTDTIPHWLEALPELQVLVLGSNQFHGTIPLTFRKHNVLRNLGLNNNQLEGHVRPSLVNCRHLEVLDLGNNKMNGTFPHWLEALPELQVLVFRSNKFHGTIGTSKTKYPFPKLRIIDLSHNEFTGLLPAKYFKNLKVVMNVDEHKTTLEYMGGDNYQDSVTPVVKGQSIELVRILTIFTSIDLSNNKFQGKIPEDIGKLNSLRGFNLSHNNLTSLIPTSLGKLSMLESLGLSSNMLVGEIPQQLTYLNYLEVLNLSHNQLVGPIPHGKQFDTFGNDSYVANQALCGFPLSKKCPNDEAPKPPPPSMPRQEDDSDFLESGFTWKVVVLGYGCGFVFGLVMGYLMFLTRKPEWFVTFVDGGRQKQVRKRSKKSGHRSGGRRN